MLDAMSGRFAVVLNRNAKKVTEKVEELSGELVPPDDLFLSSSAEESEVIARTIVERGYEAVFAGGGDGTVMHIINQLATYPLEQQPAIGILKLGTGNAMARMVSSGNVSGDLKTYITSATREYVPLSLVEAENNRFPFAGLGVDAEILNDYSSVREGVGQNPVLKPILQTVGGYFVSFFSRTMPRRTAQAFKESNKAKITVKSGICTQVNSQGEAIATFQPGDVLYDGPLLAGLVGTVPYYGYGLKILPFANVDPMRFQLRLATMPTFKALMSLPSVWKGEYEGEGMLDFLAEQIEFSYDAPAPFQMGGDAAGERDRVLFTIVPNAVRLIKLL